MARRASGRPFVAGRTNATMSEIVWSWSQTVQEWEDPGLQAIGKEPAHVPLFSYPNPEAARLGSAPPTGTLASDALTPCLEKWRRPVSERTARPAWTRACLPCRRAIVSLVSVAVL